mgnify:FL=1
MSIEKAESESRIRLWAFSLPPRCTKLSSFMSRNAYFVESKLGLKRMGVPRETLDMIGCTLAGFDRSIG